MIDIYDAAIAAAIAKGSGGGGTSDVQGIHMEMSPLTFVLTTWLIDGQGAKVGQEQTIDLPLEATIVGASYDNVTKDLTFTLASGGTLTVPLDDIIYGLQPLIDSQHKLDAALVDDTQGRYRFTWVGTAAQYAVDSATMAAGTPVIITDDTDMDTVPTQGSDNPVTSDGIKTALDGKVGTTDYATSATAGIVKPDGITTEVDENGVISVSTFAPTSWDGVQNIVRAGLASKFFKIRDQLQCMKGNTVLTWDIIGIDQETPTDPLLTHSLTLQLHDCITDLQFDAREALFALENGLAAGTYHFTVGQQPWYESDVGKTMQFTLTQAIPAGGQLVVNNAYNATMVNATISSYSSGSAATALETVTMSEGSDGTDLGTVNSAGNFTNGINSIQRALRGSGRWGTSAIRQYLNSDAAAGEVWTPQTAFDRPPAWVANTPGFLNNVDPEFVSVLGRVNKITALNTVTDGGSKETKPEKVFLLSRSEVYAGDEVTGGEGAPYSYYKNYSDLNAPGTGADKNRIKFRDGEAKYWWLRSPYVGHTNYVRDISSTGTLHYSYATNGNGVAPACVIV